MHADTSASSGAGDPESLREATAGADHVLVLADAMDEGADEHCADLLTVAPPAREHVLLVTLRETPDERVDVWRAHVGGELPAETGIVHVGGETRSAAAAAPGAGGMAGVGDPVSPPDPATGVSIEAISSPADLTGLGIKMNGYCARWAGAPEDIAVCVHGLSTLLQYVSTDRAFRFLHAMTGRLSAVEATAHYHLDPGAHDEQTVNTLRMLFDAVVEPAGDDWTVSRRSPRSTDGPSRRSEPV